MKYFTKELIINNNSENCSLLLKKIDEYNIYFDKIKSKLPQNYTECNVSFHDAKITSICFLNDVFTIEIITASTFNHNVEIQFTRVTELIIEKILLDAAWYWLYDEIHFVDANDKYEFNILIVNESYNLREIKIICNDIIIN